MICSIPLILISVYNPSLFYKNVFLSWMLHVLLMTVSTTSMVRSSSTRGIFSWSLALQNSKPRNATRQVYNVIFKHSVEYSSFMWHFFCMSLEAFISVLNIACCALFEELLFVYEGGDGDVVGEVLDSWLRVMVGKDAILTFRRDKAPLSFRPTHDWVACRSVPLCFLFYFKTWKRRFFKSGCPLPLASCSVRKCLSANYI